jgi:hypothetical protein
MIQMKPPRFTIARLMLAIIATAILLAIFRAFGFNGLLALTPFGISALLALFPSSASTRRTALAVGALGALLLPLLAAIWLNYTLWGFFIKRPALDRRIVDAKRIVSLTFINTWSNAGGRASLSGKPVYSADHYIQEHPEEGDYFLVSAGLVTAAVAAARRRRAAQKEFASLPAKTL